MVRLALALPCLLAALALAGCSESPDADAQDPSSTSHTTPPPAHVDIQGFAFKPSSVSIEAGQQVSWTQMDSAPHSVTSDAGAPAAFDSGELSSGDKYSQSFVKPGTYGYHCKYHTSMTGTITVA